MVHRNVQRLSPTTANTLSANISTAEFSKGFVTGLTAATGRFGINMPVTEEGLVEIVRNLTELAVEGNLSESLLRADCGLIAGWLLRQGGEA